MKKAKWIILIAALVVLAAALALVLTFCGNQEELPEVDDTTVAPTAGANTNYTITVQADDGTAFEGVGVYIYQDQTLEELVWYDKTNAKGQLTIDLPEWDAYVAVLDSKDLPTGYVAEEFYALTGAETTITLYVGVMSEEDMANMTYRLGDKVMDFTVTDTDGKTYTLSELLKTKKAVVLNFWYIGCEPCGNEFPYLQTAYEEHAGDIEILAMNPVDTDAAAVAQYKKDKGLTFPVIVADPNWANMMQIKGYPTTIIIDREGNISLIHQGSIESANTFSQIFEYFTADNYVSKPIKHIDEIVTETEVGTKENPYETGSFSKLEITVEPGQTYYIRLYKQVENYYLSIEGKNCEGDFTLLYKEKAYDSKNGEVTVYIRPDGTFTPVELAIINNSDETQTYTFRRSTAKGTYGNPYKMSLGEFDAKVSAGNDQGTYYTYVAEQDGTLTITCLESSVGSKMGMTLYNLKSYAMRNWTSEDGERDENGNPIVSVKAKKGQKIQFIVNTEPNDSNQYPSGTFKFLAAFEEGDGEDITVDDLPKTTYTVTVTDQFGQPVKDVPVTITGEFIYVLETEQKPAEGTETAAEGETTEPGEGETTEPGEGETTEPEDGKLEFEIKVSQALLTDANGVATTEQVSGPYTAAIRIPDGYRLEVTQYELTAEAPAANVQLHKIQYHDYTVKLQYSDGTPVEGVAVMLGNDFANTDAAGSVCFAGQEENQYTVSLAGLPAGYSLHGNATTATFAQGETTLVLTLYKAGEAQNPVEVKDYPYVAPVLQPGETVYVNFYYDTTPVLTVTDPDLVVTYNGTQYQVNPTTGVLNLPLPESEELTSVQLALTNSGTEAKAPEIQMVFPIGTLRNPEPIDDLSYISLCVAESDTKGWYYQYVNENAGTLTINLNEVMPQDVLYEFTVTTQTNGTVPMGEVTEVYMKANEPAIFFLQAVPVTVPPVEEGDEPTVIYPTIDMELTGSFEVDRDAIDDSDAFYTVTVKNQDGKAMSGVMVQIKNNDQVVASGFTDSNGVVEMLLARNKYTVSLAVSGSTKYYYEEKDAVLYPNLTSLTVEMTSTVPGAPVTDPDAYIIGEASMIYTGSTYVTMQKDANRYFLFAPGESGTYRVTVSDPDAIPSYWGMEAFPTEIVDAYNAEENYVDISIQPGQTNVKLVIGVKGADDAIITITRIGRHNWSIQEEPYSTDWQSDYVPEKFTFKGNANNLVYVDLTDETKQYNLVFNEEDQFYHLGSADGPLLYFNFGSKAPMVSIKEVMHGDGVYGGRGLSKIFLVEGATTLTQETFLKKESYTECLDAYIECADTKYDILYPLTKDIVYAIQNGCETYWTDPNNILFENFQNAVDGRQWMFAVCYEDDGTVDLSGGVAAAEVTELPEAEIPAQGETEIPAEPEELPELTPEETPEQELPAEAEDAPQEELPAEPETVIPEQEAMVPEKEELLPPVTEEATEETQE